MGLYVPLDVDYASDDKLIEAGPMAELLYVRGLAFCKRTMSDGVIRRSQLAAVGLGIPAAAKHAQRLVDVGAWTATANGWKVAAWLKRNKSAAQIKHDIDAKKAAGILANHTRWHLGEGKERPATCPHCHPHPSSQNGSQTGSDLGSDVGIPRGKTESESESEGRQSQREESSSSVKPNITSVVPSPPLDDEGRILWRVAR